MMGANPFLFCRSVQRVASWTLDSRAGRVAAASLAFLFVFQPSVPAQPTNSTQTHLEFGNPGGNCTLLDKQYFVTCHDNGRRIPQWVAYRLRSSDLTGNQARTDDFRPDPALDEDVRAELSDYRNSGFDRGHMAPAADFTRSRRAMSTTFLLSNMGPQRPRLNRGIWERLESQVRDLTSDVGTVWVITGPLLTNQLPPGYKKTIGNGRVAVPTQFFKVILARDASGDFEMFAFVMPNSRNAIQGRPADFETTVDEVEQLSGLDFFDRLDDSLEDSLEASVGDWPFN